MPRNLYKSARLLLILLLTASTAQAQELNCKVKVMHEKIQNTDPQVFRTMERAITEFLNTRKWTKDDFAPHERIDCNILINLTAKLGTDDDSYTATLNIQASRPVYNSGYTTPTVNFIDRSIAFRYSQFAPLQFDDNRVSGTDPLGANLTAVLAYYAYLVLGLDYESFEAGAGEFYFKRAQHIVNNAPEQGSSISGWKAFEDKTNRFWIVDQLLSPRFSSLLAFWYTMHREGLDMMHQDPVAARQKILSGIATLSQLQRENPGSIILQFFFNAKSDELTRIVAQLPRQERAGYITMLSQMDVANATRYNSLK